MVMADNYTKAESQLDFNDISQHIAEENLQNILRSPLD
jgi:hypothetical protein